jgi:chromosome segregation ATPase
MLKKLLIGGAALAAVAGVVLGTDLLSYVRTSARKVRSEVKATIPLDFEIERAREMVGRLVPDIQENMHLIAQEEVEVEELQGELTKAGKNLETERQQLLSLRSDLDNGQGKVRYAGRKATGDEMRAELNHRFEHFKTAEATIGAKRKMLEAREKTLSAARQKLEGMLGAKRDLEVQVQNLEARLKMVQAVQTTSQFHFDDSQLSRCKKLVQDLRKHLDVAERMMEQDGRLFDNLSIEPDAPEDIAEQIDQYFRAKPAGGAAEQAAL